MLKLRLWSLKLMVAIKFMEGCVKVVRKCAENCYEEFITEDALNVINKNRTLIKESFQELFRMESEDKAQNALDSILDLSTEIAKKCDIVFNY